LWVPKKPLVYTMNYDPKIHHRRSIRLKGFDYSNSGYYFITICCQNKRKLWGNIKNDQMFLNDAGRMIESVWNNLPTRFPKLILHNYVVMPNHFHAIVEFLCVEDGTRLSEVIDAFKSITTVEYIHGVKKNGWLPFIGKVWQRNYWEHIIRSQDELFDISEYIIYNPVKWRQDNLFEL